MTKNTLIIAEAGVNHNGSLKSACNMIEVAAEAGADLVKFQSFNPSKVVTKSAPKAEYQILNSGVKESQLDMIKNFYLSYNDHKVIIKHCKKCNIGFFSTAFDIESLEMLVDLGLNLFKIPSGEITNYPLLREIGSLNKSVIMSTGMAEMSEIEDAINVLESYGTNRENLTILHCNTNYPTPVTDVNLNVMKTIKEKFNVNVGFSDHTMGIEVSLAAVALGANVIEKHFTIDRSLPGPDQKCSLEPIELKLLVQSIRNIEVSLGSQKKIISEAEIKNKSIARKSIVAAKKIKKNEKFSETNITSKRPGNGISPMKWEEVLGQKAKKDFEFDELIEL